MSEPNTTQGFEKLENKLDTIYNSASPDPVFAGRLEMMLAARSKAMQAPAVRPKPSPLQSLWGSFRRPALAIALAVVLLLVLSVGVIGPQKVLAQVQRLLGYAPGYGFVEPGETRILPAPVEVTQGDVTLRITGVTADSRETQVALDALGLPHEKFGPDEGPTSPEVQPYLLLPDGTRLEQQAAISGMGDTLQATLSFSPLPKDVTQVTLVLPRLPSLPAGFAPENWSVILELQNTQVAGTAAAEGLSLTQPYMPENVTVSEHGVTTRLLQVGQNDQETGLQVQYDWKDASWVTLREVQINLTDDQAHQYAMHPSTFELNTDPQSSPAVPGMRTITYRFDALDKQAKTGILNIDKLNFGITSQASYRFNPGGTITDGQTWELSQLPGTRLEVAGVPVQLLSLRIYSNPNPRPESDNRYLMELFVQTYPHDGLALNSLFMSQFADRTVSANCETLPDSRLRLTIGIPELPVRPMKLYLSSGELSVTGPWKMEWNIPVK